MAINNVLACLRNIINKCGNAGGDDDVLQWTTREKNDGSVSSLLKV